MKSNYWRVPLCVFIFLLFLYVHRLNAEADLLIPNQDVFISMDLQNANLKDVLKIFSIQSGLNFIASEGIQDRLITLYLDKVPIKEAMSQLFKANNLSYDLEPEAKIIIVKDWGKLQVETITKVFYLKHASVASSALKLERAANLLGGGAGGGDAGITAIVKKLLSTNGSVVEDPRTNSLIVTDTPNRISVVTQAIAALDVPVAQVMLEVEMLDVSKGAVDQLGVNWPQTLMSLDVSGARTTSFPFFGNKADNNPWFVADEVTSPSGKWKFQNFYASHWMPSVFTFIGAQLTLDFLKTQSDTKVLARPRILTLNNEVAEIKITTQETVGSKTETTNVAGSSTSTTTFSSERMETGVTLRVTPQINPDTGEITMFIMPKVKDTGATVSVGPTTAKDPEERTTKSVVKIKDGETVIIGGLIHQKFSQTDKELPVFSKIPVLGALFRHKNKDKDTERELLVFITPHIIKDGGLALAQAKRVTFPEREQNTASGFDRQALISSSLASFEQKKKR